MRRVPDLVLAAAIALAAASPCRADTYPRATSIDTINYRITLKLMDQSDEISAETDILFAVIGDSVKEIALDFAGLTVDRVTEGGREATFHRVTDGRLAIALGGTYRRGDRMSVAVAYHGRPTDGLFIKKNKFGDNAIFADNWPNRAHFWFPSIDHPYDKATVDFVVTAPSRFDVIANGELVEVTSNQDGTKLTRWRESVPIPTYCMVVGATEFSILNEGAWNGTALSYYLFPKDRANGVKDYGRALQMIEFFSNLVGAFPYEKLALVQSSTRFGGMENSSNIFFDEKAYNGSGRLEGTVAHEIAHQWFGDSVTEGDWHHLWLSEGFATYFAHLFFERAEGRDGFVSAMRADREAYLKEFSNDPRPIHDPAITDLFKLLNANNYQKGGWVLHMLRHVMGDRNFFDGVREYYRTFRDRNALTDDLRQTMERHSPERLDWFFKQWIFEPGYPVYDATWRFDESAKELKLTIRQTQSWTTFRMPLDIEIRTGGRIKREVVDLREREGTFTFSLEEKPSSILIDPDEWVLKILTIKEG